VTEAGDAAAAPGAPNEAAEIGETRADERPNQIDGASRRRTA
jgi:hypothetical protein